MNTEAPSVTTGIVISCGERVVGLKLQTNSFELNLLLTDRDVRRLLDCLLPKTPDERSLPVGTCFGAPAYWSRIDDKYLGITIGHDDVTWDAGFWMPINSLDDIRSEVAAAAGQL